MSEADHPLFELLVRRVRGVSRARTLMEEVSVQIGAASPQDERIVTALALVRAGTPVDSVSALLSWNEFEGFCASLMSANGYSVTRSVVMTKPRRQIDIVARSSDLCLSVDCKHWGSGFTPSKLEEVVKMQVERTSQYKHKFRVIAPMLPVVVTMLDVPARLVLGVPVVPVFALRDFLSIVSRFDEGLRIL